METRTKRPISGTTRRPVDILIVEIDADSREALAIALEDDGCIVRTAASASQAEALIRERAPDVVLSDLDLGRGETGWVLAERLREDPKTRHVGRIAMTGRIDHTTQGGSTFDAYLRKPIELPLLLELVEQLSVIGRAIRRGAAM